MGGFCSKGVFADASLGGGQRAWGEGRRWSVKRPRGKDWTEAVGATSGACERRTAARPAGRRHWDGKRRELSFFLSQESPSDFALNCRDTELLSPLNQATGTPRSVLATASAVWVLQQVHNGFPPENLQLDMLGTSSPLGPRKHHLNCFIHQDSEECPKSPAGTTLGHWC